MAYTKYAYTRVNWKNKSESLETPLGKTNLNRMDSAIYQIAENVDVVYNEMDAKKLDKSSVGKMLSATPTWDADTGILTFQFYDGTEFSVDFNIEKIPVYFSMDSSGLITMTTADGTQWTANIADMIPDYKFENSDRIVFTKTKNEDGSYKITADIVKGSITGDYLEPNYLSNVTTQASKAEASANSAGTYADNASYDAKLAQSYAVGGSGIRDGEDTDNAKKYAQDAKDAADRASEIVGGNFITQSEKGIAGGVASLDDNGKIPVSQIPDDISVNEMTGATEVEDGKAGLVPKPTMSDRNKALFGDGTYKEVKVGEMKGATADKDGTSGTVPAPLAGQEKLFLRGDGKWAEAKQDLSAYYNNANYDTENNKLQLMNGDTVLKEIEISGGGGTKIPPKATVNPTIINGNAKVTITWGDPEDVIADGVILSTWKGTKLVMKETGYPEDENDGIVLVDNKTKDAYVSTGYEVTGLTNGNTYYFKLFPYSTDGIYNYQDSNKLLGNPSLVKLDSCTNMSLSLAMGSVTVSWTDPDAEKTVDENTATWAKTVLVYKQGSTAPSSVSDGIVAVEETTRNQYSVDGFTVDGLTDGEQYSFALFAVSTEGVSSDATTATANLWATLTITTDETKLYEKEVTVTYGSSTVSGTFSSIGSVTLQIPWIGETTITSTDGTDTATSVVTISAYESTYSVDLSFLKIVSFSDGTWEQIGAMIEAYYNGDITLEDTGWAVGDVKQGVPLSAIAASSLGGDNQSAQTIDLVIIGTEHDDLKTPINGKTKAMITVHQVNCLATKGKMNISYNNFSYARWSTSPRKTWCSSFKAALPSDVQSLIKQVTKKSVYPSNTSNTNAIDTTTEECFLLSNLEVFGSNYSSLVTTADGTQYDYYKVQNNRIKKVGDSASYWWTRSGCWYIGGARFITCIIDGSALHINADDAFALALGFCL